MPKIVSDETVSLSELTFPFFIYFAIKIFKFLKSSRVTEIATVRIYDNCYILDLGYSHGCNIEKFHILFWSTTSADSLNTERART